MCCSTRRPLREEKKSLPLGVRVPPVHVLSIHADYACRNSGACCTSGWPIAIEHDRRLRVAAAVEAGRLHTRDPAGNPVRDPAIRSERAWLAGQPGDSGPLVLATDVHGRCVFYDAERERHCAIHSALGDEALPLACRQFPRVTLHDDRGVFVTLSHYCPTAASMLFRDDGALEIRSEAPAFPAGGEYVGLDAVGALPPLLRPDLLMDLDSYTAWERYVVTTLGAGTRSPEAALAEVRDVTESLRTWRPADGPLRARLDGVIGGALQFAADSAGVPSREDGLSADASRLRTAGDDRQSRTGFRKPFADRLESYVVAVACVPRAVRMPRRFHLADPDAAARACERFVEPEWPAFVKPVGRYLAARAFGNWFAYQGRGLRSTVESISIALDIVVVQAARLTLASSHSLDRAILAEAIRAADLLLVHLVAPQAFADRLAHVEL